jgi:hypothetical protein
VARASVRQYVGSVSPTTLITGGDASRAFSNLLISSLSRMLWLEVGTDGGDTAV